MPFGPSPIDPVKDGIYKQIEKEGVPFSVKPIFLKVPSIKGEVANYTRDYNKHRFYELYVEHLKQIGQGIKPQKTQSSDLFVLDGAVLTRYLANVEKTLSKLLGGKCKDHFSRRKAFNELDVFLVMVYLSAFFGVSKYLTDLQSKKKFTKKQNVTINIFRDDANHMKGFSRDILSALSTADTNSFDFEEYCDAYYSEVSEPLAGLFGYCGALHKYAYGDESGVDVFPGLLQKAGLTGENSKNVYPSMGEGYDFVYWWACRFQRIVGKSSDSLSQFEDNYYGAGAIIPLVKDMYSLGGDYVCWPLINTYYKLVGEITGNRLKREKTGLEKQTAAITRTCNDALAWARKAVKQMPEESK